MVEAFTDVRCCVSKTLRILAASYTPVTESPDRVPFAHEAQQLYCISCTKGATEGTPFWLTTNSM